LGEGVAIPEMLPRITEKVLEKVGLEVRTWWL
jgi:hypothetical protein